eukprot:745009_1
MSNTTITQKAHNKTDTLKDITQGSMKQTSKKYQAKTFYSDDSITNSINHMMNNSYTYNYKPKYRVTRLTNPPSFMRYGSLQFFIMDAPTDDNLRTYIKDLNQ